MNLQLKHNHRLLLSFNKNHWTDKLSIFKHITVQLQHSMAVFMTICQLHICHNAQYTHLMVMVSDDSCCVVKRGKNQFMYHLIAIKNKKMLPNKLKMSDQLFTRCINITIRDRHTVCYGSSGHWVCDRAITRGEWWSQQVTRQVIL